MLRKTISTIKISFLFHFLFLFFVKKLDLLTLIACGGLTIGFLGLISGNGDGRQYSTGTLGNGKIWSGHESKVFIFFVSFLYGFYMMVKTMNTV